MPATMKSPMALRAADLMSADVVLLPAEMSLQGAARLLYRMQISGAPVVDDRGHIVGILSTTDFMHRLEAGTRPAAAAHSSDPICCPWEICDQDTEAAPRDIVRDFMTRDVVTVPRDMPLPDLARTMLEAHIHRLVVVDNDERPLGIVSTTDILAALARAAGIALNQPVAVTARS